MKFALFVTLVALTICFTSCKKEKATDSPNGGSNVEILEQSISYKFIATIPSPADSAKGLLKDSLRVFRKKFINEPDFFTNIPNIGANISENALGFTFGYDDPANSLPYFGFSTYAFPSVPRDFLLNKLYENMTVPGNPNNYPLFLGTHTGNDGMTYFVNNVYPSDADSPSSKTYTSIIFTNKFTIGVPDGRGKILFGSGRISGYAELYWGKTDPSKYVQRWDFTIDFTDLKID